MHSCVCAHGGDGRIAALIDNSRKMSFPWIMEERLGRARPHQANRVGNPTMTTPATFDMNWEHSVSENGPTDPRPDTLVSTFMGVSKTAHAGKGKEYPDEQALALRAALEIVRKEGYTCILPPEDYEEDTSDDEEAEKDPELAYLRDEYYEGIEVTKGNESVFTMSMASDWIYIRCATEAAAELVEEKFAPHFALDRVGHEERLYQSEMTCKFQCVLVTEQIKSALVALGLCLNLKRVRKSFARRFARTATGRWTHLGQRLN